MILLFDPMSLITPEIGYSFWTTVAFVIFWFILGKFAFKPIVNAINKRNEDIQNQLDAAKKAKKDLENLQVEKQNAEKEAHEERIKMMAEAKKDVESYRATEMQKAREEASRLLEQAKSEIQNEKARALNDVKKEVAQISLSIAEKLVKEKMQVTESQNSLIEKLLAEA